LAQAQCPLTGSDRTEGLKLHVRVHPEIVEKQAIQLRNLIPLPEATKDVSIFNEFWTLVTTHFSVRRVYKIAQVSGFADVFSS